jgi:Uma2 family endonuclease
MALSVPDRVKVDVFEVFLTRPENRGRQFELIDGAIVEKMPTEEHGVIAGNFYAALRDFVRPRGLGRVLVEARYQVEGDPVNVRQPDVSFTRTERLQPLVTRGASPTLPDIAVEVQSPDDSLASLREKAAYLTSHGVALVWIALPRKRLVEVCRADGSVDILTADDTLEAGDVLPGFHVPVRDLFEE